MGVVRDIFNIAKSVTADKSFNSIGDIEDIFDDDDGVGVSKVRSASYDSIARQAKHGVLQFPVLASDSLSFENIQMVAKACERNFSSLLQVIFTMNQITDDGDPLEYIRKFHQNSSTSVNGPSDVMSFVFNSDISAAMQADIMRQVKEGMITFEEMFTMDSLNSKYIPKDMKMIVSMEALRHGDDNRSKPNKNYTTNINNNNYHTITNKIVDKSPSGPRSPKDNIPDKMLVETDVKKANEMQPTLMHVRILREAREGQPAQYIDFIVGVKAVVHALTSADIVDHMVSIFQDRGTLFKLITWTTGEIQFFKDLLFSVDSIKSEIRDTRSGKSSIWWTALKNIKAKKRLHKYTGRSPVLPNATIVLSMEEVDFIKANYKFDIMEDDSGKKILNALNLIQVCVVDSASEVLFTMNDGSDHWELVTFKGLERDAGNADKQFKDILKAVNKLQ